ncbi:MAG: hypothetical protein AAFN70_09380, partial [Planctomycetota bacterium]
MSDESSRNQSDDSKRPRVLFVNRSYWPDAEATGQLLTDLCESLADEFDVHVLCGQPNSNPTDAEYSVRGTQIRNHVTIHRLKHSQFNKRRGWGRMANLLTFTWAARSWMRARQRSANKNQQQAFDVVISETDPFLLPIVTAPFANRMNAPFVAYLQDIYPDIAVRLGAVSEGWKTRRIRAWLTSAYQDASGY